MNQVFLLSAVRERTAELSSTWRARYQSRHYCRVCQSMLPVSFGEPLDIDIRSGALPKSRGGHPADAGVELVVWLSGVQVLREEFGKALGVDRAAFGIGRLSVDGVPYPGYLVLNAKSSIRVDVRPAVVRSEGNCRGCSRIVRDGEPGSGLWIASEEVRDRTIVADALGSGPYVTEALYEALAPELKAELKRTLIQVRSSSTSSS